VTDYACAQYSAAPRGRACGERESQCLNGVRPVRPLDEASLTIRKNNLTAHQPEAIASQRTRRPDDIRDVPNTYLVGRSPSRSSPHRRSRTIPIRKGPAIQHRRRGLIAPRAHFAHFYLARHSPNHPPTISKTTCPRDQLHLPAWKPATHRGKMLKLIH
jgi:hypothetical protein